MKKQILILVAFFALSGTLLAQTPEVITSSKPGWHKIADLKVSFKTDKDEVMVMGNDHFKQLKLKAYEATVDITSAEVYYENEKTPQVLSVGTMLRAGMESKTFTLRDADISRVVLIYKTIPVKVEGSEKANVEIWGMK